jgi:DNA-binding SARP family transcriptional activator
MPPQQIQAGSAFGILGSLQVLSQGRPVALGPRKQQLALALLLANANSLVPVDTLIDALWEDSPPRTARKNLQVYICTLRGLLGAGRSRPRITHRPGGYCLDADAAELDWLLFERKVADSRRLWQGGQPAVLAALLAEALRLWRGPVLDGLRGGSVIDAVAQRLESTFLTTFEDWAEAEVAAGGALGAIDRIASLARQHPFRERLRMVQMTALAQIGRRTEALGVYDELRRSLARDFGLAPSAALMAQYEALLRDGVPAPPRRPAGEPLRRLAALSLLPPDLACFTGRESCLRDLSEAFTDGERLAVLAGPVGVGKTTLAVRAAHLLSSQFQDGCCFVRLRGEDGTPRPLPQVMSQLWWAAPESGPAGQPADVAQAWQRWLATHRALVVLDGARREAEVRPLLPEAGESAVIVTAQSRLTGLGPAYRVTMPPLRLDEAMDLLRRIIGRERVDRDPPAAERIVRAAGLLPLGVRVIGDRLAALGHVPVHEYAPRVVSAAVLLDEPTAGGLTVRDRLARATGDLPAAARAAFPALGRLPRPVFTLAEAAGVLSLGEAAALQVLEIMLEASVILAPDSEVVAHAVIYQMPALAHAYARELAGLPRPPKPGR